jgi:serine protease Do
MLRGDVILRFEGKKIISPEENSDWGMVVQELTPQLTQQLGLYPGTAGVMISGIPEGSPAAEAGLHPGDLITEVNRTAVKNMEEYQQSLQKAEKGDHLLLLIKRAAGLFYTVLTSPVKGSG